MTTDILSAVRSSLRITATDYDDEISTLIAAAKADLRRGGVLQSQVDDTDPMIRVAIICYVKSAFGLDNAEASRYAVAYQSMLSALKCSSDYGQTLTVAT